MATRQVSRVLIVAASVGMLSMAAAPGRAQPVEPLRPVERVPRAEYGVVGPAPLTAADVAAFVFPDATDEERAALLDGLTFFTTPHTAAEGLGPDANQPFCLGCHTNSAEQLPNAHLLMTPSHISRAARSTPTNFAATAGDATVGGHPPDFDETVDKRTGTISGTGRTAAFTIFGDFNPAATPQFNGLTVFGGFVQHTRPSLAACLPDRIPAVDGTTDPNLPGVFTDPLTGVLMGAIDPVTWLATATGYRRTVGERGAPPYRGLGLIEAIPDEAIMALEDPDDTRADRSSLADPTAFPECTGDCIAGRHNQNASDPSHGGVVGGDLPPRVDGGSTVRLARFGLRAGGPTLVQFVTGGMQGELSLTSALRPTEVNQADINIGRPGCTDMVPDPEVSLPTVDSIRTLMRLTTTAEFGDALLSLLTSADPTRPRPGRGPKALVQRGAALFGVDLEAFANRTIPGRMPAGGDGLDPNAINQDDRLLDCAGCHTPIQATGQSPADVGGRLLSDVWAPVFSDLLLHRMTSIDAERHAATPRNPVIIRRLARGEAAAAQGLGVFARTFDISRSLADDALPAQGIATGYEWRTPPLMALGRIGPPFLHDARVYLSAGTARRLPAGTVQSSSEFTNAPLVVRTLDDALYAVIELHDLPPPDDAKTPHVAGAGCPVPEGGRAGGVDYGVDPASVICPPYDSDVSKENRSDAREVIRRYRALSPDDQQALVEFLKQL